ncbi:serine hydrolase domain-containing protein [Paractinoplanes ferrugineus]|uniref:Esterase/lipase LipP n=1 Tax=Paractinoplanes ferrugineus TaxID=113564 RepID=A0A919IXV3_9ACTN|nr:serine hydrolase domain-containing protein [Actinoplanes ferrugineus]GIE10855.1 putative esterase/lipase LipP [Actinoplanes ferrugineus]
MDLRRVVGLVERSEALAQLCVIRDGEVVLDRSWGVPADARFLLFSAGKPFTAMLVHRLARRGLLALDDPIVRYWPEFGEFDKGGITLRHVLRHRSGLPYVKSIRGDALNATRWDRSVRALARARPHSAPGEVCAYHMISYGFLLGEVVQRVVGRPLPEVLRSEMFEPAGMRHTWLGGPGSRVPLSGGPVAMRAVFNRRLVRDAVVPAATVAGTARDLAAFYQSLLADGSWREATTPTSEGETDQVSGIPIRWSEGFQLGQPGRERYFGSGSDPLTFGHNGSNACFGWADPGRRLVVAYLTNRLGGGPGRPPYQAALSDAVLEAA